jgi:chemotaxis protein histidine kinase CheA
MSPHWQHPGSSFDADFRRVFITEAQSLLVEAEAAVLRIERMPGSMDDFNLLFRVAHSFKGSALSVGYEGVGRFAHHLESLLDVLRIGRLQADDALVGCLLRGIDALSEEITRLAKNPDDTRLSEGDAAFLIHWTSAEPTPGTPELRTSNEESLSPSLRVEHPPRMPLKGNATERIGAPTPDELSSASFLLSSFRRGKANGPQHHHASEADSSAPYVHLPPLELASKWSEADLDLFARLFAYSSPTQGEGHQNFATEALSALRMHPEFADVGRVCVASWVGIARRLSVIDSAVPEGIKKPYGPGLFVLPT